jgi:ABC-type multidrug transport system fused ATPase/permease subunit
MLRLYDPTGGHVRVDGVDVRDLVAAAPRPVGIVTQDVQLFEASLRDNSHCSPKRADDARLVSVLEELDLGPCCGDCSGLDTLIGGEGVGLSAGEAQLLAFGLVPPRSGSCHPR